MPKTQCMGQADRVEYDLDFDSGEACHEKLCIVIWQSY